MKKFNLTRNLGFIILFCGISTIFAQVGARYTLLPSARIVKVNPPPGEKAEMSMGLFDINAGIPLYVNENKETGEIFFIENELSFRHHTFDLKLPAGQDEYFPKTLYALTYSISTVKTLYKEWFGIGFLSTGIYTDFENVNSDHFKIEGGFFIARKAWGNFTFGLGPVFTYAFGNPLFIPAPLIKYTGVNDKFTIDIRVPKHIILSYTYSDNLQNSLKIGSLYSNYRLGDKRARDTTDGKSTTIVFSDIIISLETLVRLYGPLVLEFSVGSTLNREFTVENHKEKELFDRGMKNTLFFSAGIKLL